MNPDVRKLPPLPEAVACVRATDLHPSYLEDAALCAPSLADEKDVLIFTSAQMHAYALAALTAQDADDAVDWERALDRATDRIVAAQGAAPVAAPPEDHRIAADLDARIYGTGYLVDDRHVSPDRIKIITTRRPPPPAAPEVDHTPDAVGEALDTLDQLESSIDGLADCTDTVRQHIATLTAQLAAAERDAAENFQKYVDANEARIDAERDAARWHRWFPWMRKTIKRAPLDFFKELDDYAAAMENAK